MMSYIFFKNASLVSCSTPLLKMPALEAVHDIICIFESFAMLSCDVYHRRAKLSKDGWRYLRWRR